MEIDPSQLTVIHNRQADRFEIRVDSALAVLDYRRMGKIILFTHTGVPPELEGRGIGSKLVKAGLDYARENSLNVQTLCWFVDLYIKRHPEYQALAGQ